MDDEQFRREQQRLYRMVDQPLRYPRSLTQLAEDLAVEPFRYRKARKMLEMRRLRKATA